MINYEDLERLKRESDRVWEKDGKILSGLAREYFKERGKIMGEFVRRCKEEEIDDRLIIITLFTEVLEMIYALNEIDPSIKDSVIMALKYDVKDVGSIEEFVERIKEDSKGYI